jgi:hypothetical protein
MYWPRLSESGLYMHISRSFRNICNLYIAEGESQDLRGGFRNNYVYMRGFSRFSGEVSLSDQYIRQDIYGDWGHGNCINSSKR